ncbi:MAG: type II toxin-antitoxin system RelE/ParE family toxin [Gemmatimonadota bacterium]|nr:type II toxin-antitoxin system RelE/ParE family toxin [Gemmatimonadota bacterium]
MGFEFLRAARAVLALIERNPSQFPVVLEDIRRSHLLRFPYAVYYFIEDQRIVVIACAHDRRHPRRWASRR